MFIDASRLAQVTPMLRHNPAVDRDEDTPRGQGFAPLVAAVGFASVTAVKYNVKDNI
jgi:hypothetical protein